MSPMNETNHPEYDVSAGVSGDFADDFEEIPAPETDDLPAERYLDRELSWLAFNNRVLELAEDPDVPLLERVNFLAIFASNLDEFFMVRVAGLKRRVMTGIAVPTNTGRSPQQVLDDISAMTHELQERHAERFMTSSSQHSTLRTSTSSHGVIWARLTASASMISSASKSSRS